MMIHDSGLHFWATL